MFGCTGKDKIGCGTESFGILEALDTGCVNTNNYCIRIDGTDFFCQLMLESRNSNRNR